MNLFTPGNKKLKKEIYSLQGQISFSRYIEDTTIIPGWAEMAASMIKNKKKLLEEKKNILFKLEPNQKTLTR